MTEEAKPTRDRSELRDREDWTITRSRNGAIVGATAFGSHEEMYEPRDRNGQRQRLLASYVGASPQ